MKKITTLLVCYMLAVALCATGIVLNSDSASASNGTILGGAKNQTLDIVLWILICVVTVAVIVTSIIIVYNDKRSRKQIHSNS